MKKSGCLVLLFGIISCSGFLGQDVNLTDLPALKHDYKDNVSGRKYQVSEIEVFSFARENEYFTDKDTLHRDYIRLNSAENFILDPLCGLLHREYTVAYDLVGVYLAPVRKNSYIILVGGDTFTMGSDQRLCFIVLRKKSNQWDIYKSYTHIGSTGVEDVRVKQTKRRIHLYGEQLRQIKRLEKAFSYYKGSKATG